MYIRLNYNLIFRIVFLTIVLFEILWITGIYADSKKYDPREILKANSEISDSSQKPCNGEVIYKRDSGLLNQTVICISESWQSCDNRYKRVNDYGEYAIVFGHDGYVEWRIVDGQLSILNDTATIINRFLDSLMDEGEHLTEDSKYFAVEYVGCTLINERTCYSVKITNSLNDRVNIDYIDTTDFKSRCLYSKSDGDEYFHILYDHKFIKGILYPFKIVSIRLPGYDSLIVVTTDFEVIDSLDDSFFSPPLGMPTMENQNEK